MFNYRSGLKRSVHDCILYLEFKFGRKQLLVAVEDQRGVCSLLIKAGKAFKEV